MTTLPAAVKMSTMPTLTECPSTMEPTATPSVFGQIWLNNHLGVCIAYTGIENLTVKAILADYANDADEILTIWASYQIGDLLIGFEYADDDKNTAAPGTAGVYTDDNIEAYLLMANYAITDSAAITVRYSEADYIDASTVTVDKFTISPSYAFTDDLAGLIEYSTYDVEGGTEPDELLHSS